MEIAVLGFVGSKNIGDYIQTKAAIDISIPKKQEFLIEKILTNTKMMT